MRRRSGGVIVDRGIRVLRASLWAGATFDLVTATWLGLGAVLAAHPVADGFYSAALAVTLAVLGGVRLVAAYAPYGNRRIIRILAGAGLAMAVACWWFDRGTAPFEVAAVIHTILALGLLLGLRLARL